MSEQSQFNDSRRSKEKEETNIKDMDLETAMNELRIAVYEGTRLLEDLERAGKLYGNAHHVRQALAEGSAYELALRWRKSNLGG